MALTAENFAANLKTAALNAAAAAGVDPAKRAEWTVAQRQKFNRELVAVILKYPGSFSADTVNRAAEMNTDYGLRGHTFDSVFSTGIGAALDGAKTYVNRLLMALAVVAVFYFVFIAALTRPRRA